METKIIRSKRRKKTVEASLQDGVLVVRAPANIPEAELNSIIAKLAERLARKRAKAGLRDDLLLSRARELNRRYFGGKLEWASIRWVTNQQKRLGSCTPGRKTIRISHRVAELPPFVRDYVIMHELAHLVEANHSPRFWELVSQYPRAERARGYLMALGAEPLDEV